MKKLRAVYINLSLPLQCTRALSFSMFFMSRLHSTKVPTDVNKPTLCQELVPQPPSTKHHKSISLKTTTPKMPPSAAFNPEKDMPDLAGKVILITGGTYITPLATPLAAEKAQSTLPTLPYITYPQAQHTLKTNQSNPFHPPQSRHRRRRSQHRNRPS